MISKWICDKYGWEGNEPITINGEYEACPNGCKSALDGLPRAVLLNPNNSENMFKFVKALSECYK